MCAVQYYQRRHGEIAGAEQGGTDLYIGAQGLHAGSSTWARSKRNRVLAEIGGRAFNSP